MHPNISSKKVFEEKMKNAYLDLVQENLEISNDSEYSEAENPWKGNKSVKAA